MESADIDLDLDLDLDPNFEPQSRARSNTWPLRPNREVDPQSSPVGGVDEATNGADAQSKDPLGLQAKKSGSRRNAWGNLSYADLITKAIQSSPEKRLTLSQIYDWMVQNVPYFKGKGDSTSSAGWKNSIRHNLSLHNRFMRIQNEGTGKSSWWVLNPDAKPGKAPRRRAGSMETKNFEKKRGRVRKKVEALRVAMENGGFPGGTATALSPGGSEDYLDTLGLGDIQTFRQRTSSNASSCGGRLSPIHAAVEPDMHDSQVPPMSPIPWGQEVGGSCSPTVGLYPPEGNGYSDLVDSLVDGMKLSNQDLVLSDNSNSSNNGGPNGSYMGNVVVDGVCNNPDGATNYQHLPAPPPYPKVTSTGQQQQQLNGLEFSRQSLHNALRMRQQMRNGLANAGQLNISISTDTNNGSGGGGNSGGTSPYGSSNIDLYGVDDFSAGGSTMIKQEPSFGQSSNIGGSLMANRSHGTSPDRPVSQNSGGSSPNLQLTSHHHHHQLTPQQQMSLSPINCQQQQLQQQQLSPQQIPQQLRQLLQQQLPSTTATTHQQQQASILREALTRGPVTYRPPNTTSPTFSPTHGNLSPQSSALSPLSSTSSNIMVNGNVMISGSNAGSDYSLSSNLSPIPGGGGMQSLRSPCSDQVNFLDNTSSGQPMNNTYGFNTNTSALSHNSNNSGSNMPGALLDIDMDLIKGLDDITDIDQVILLEGNFSDVNFDTGPVTTVSSNVVH